MAFFESLGGKIKNAGQNIAQSTKKFADVTKLKSGISDYEKKINELYFVMGKAYYERHKDDTNAEDQKSIDAINTLFKQISDLKEEIREKEGIATCPNCGKDVPGDAVFCNNCGCKIVKETKETKETAKCPDCGAALPADAVFCNNCGCKITKEPEVRLCANCGQPLPESSMFCAHCGTKVETLGEKTEKGETETEG